MRGPVIVGLLLAVALAGFAAGRASIAAPPAPSAVASLEPRPEPLPAAPDEAPRPAPAAGAKPCTVERIVVPAMKEPLPTELKALQDQNAELRAAVAQLQHATKQEELERSRENGPPIPKPKELAPRFEETQLRENVQSALKEAGFDKAEVTSIDCTEFPCIVYGEGMGGREDFEKLDRTGSMHNYADDSHSAFGWESGGRDGGPGTARFGVALYPKGEGPRDPLVDKRIRYRWQQMAETFHDD